jgi:hypothetical protein
MRRLSAIALAFLSACGASPDADLKQGEPEESTQSYAAQRAATATATARDGFALATPLDPASLDGGAARNARSFDDPSLCKVVSIPSALRTSYELAAFYTRYADANGVPVIASDKPAEESIHRACLLILDYSSVREDVRQALRDGKIRFIVMARSEKTVDTPDFAYLGDLDWRARGLGGVPAGICAEESILCDKATDRWRGESICVHEFSHTMQMGAYNKADKTFASRLAAAYRAARAAGLFTNTYAGEQAAEYFAEGVQDWYNTNLQTVSGKPDGVHNDINTRAELEKYDPALYKLLSEVLPDKPRYRDCYYYP